MFVTRSSGMTRHLVPHPAERAPTWACGMGMVDTQARLRYARALRRLRRQLREAKGLYVVRA